LFSFGASGQLGEALVYFPWKGIDAVRTYVIPANPNTAAQQAQRSKLHTSVDCWHTDGLVAADVTAWNRYAATRPTPQSGFNAFVASRIAVLIAGFTPEKLIAGAITPGGVGLFNSTITEGGLATAADLLWGYSPTSLINTQALAEAVNVWTHAGTVAISGCKVYGRFRIKTGANIVGYSGIFTCTIV
jgi:hypothetical protein